MVLAQQCGTSATAAARADRPGARRRDDLRPAAPWRSGLEAEQTSAGGLATAQCQGPGTDFWFVGPGQKSVADIQLYLMNTDAQAADATVSVLTDSGPMLGSTDAGIEVPPHGLVRPVPGQAAERDPGWLR